MEDKIIPLKKSGGGIKVSDFGETFMELGTREVIPRYSTKNTYGTIEQMRKTPFDLKEEKRRLEGKLSEEKLKKIQAADFMFVNGRWEYRPHQRQAIFQSITQQKKEAAKPGTINPSEWTLAGAQNAMRSQSSGGATATTEQADTMEILDGLGIIYAFYCPEMDEERWGAFKSIGKMDKEDAIMSVMNYSKNAEDVFNSSERCWYVGKAATNWVQRMYCHEWQQFGAINTTEFVKVSAQEATKFEAEAIQSFREYWHKQYPNGKTIVDAEGNQTTKTDITVRAFVLEFCAGSEIDQREGYWIGKLNALHGFNTAKVNEEAVQRQLANSSEPQSNNVFGGNATVWRIKYNGDNTATEKYCVLSTVGWFFWDLLQKHDFSAIDGAGEDYVKNTFVSAEALAGHVTTNYKKSIDTQNPTKTFFGFYVTGLSSRAKKTDVKELRAKAQTCNNVVNQFEKQFIEMLKQGTKATALAEGIPAQAFN